MTPAEDADSRSSSTGAGRTRPGTAPASKPPRIPLEEAMSLLGIPLDNRPFVRAIAAHVGISGCEVKSTYIKAYRADRGRPLRIAPGWTNGFLSREEAKAAAGDAADTWESDRSPLWGVSHPVTWTGHGGGGRAEAPARDFGMCPVHFVALPATGVCDLCE